MTHPKYYKETQRMYERLHIKKTSIYKGKVLCPECYETGYLYEDIKIIKPTMHICNYKRFRVIHSKTIDGKTVYIRRCTIRNDK